VVIAIIAIVVAVVAPALAHARRSAVRSACAGNLRSIGVALSSYRAEYDQYPPAPALPLPERGERGLFIMLAPFIDAPVPVRAADGAFVVGAPWRCPGDPGLHGSIGTSYEYRLNTLANALAADQRPGPWRLATRRAESPPDVPLVSDSRSVACSRFGVGYPWHPSGKQSGDQAVFGDGRVETLGSSR
ncbi:MAG: DUF1559 domain-containing protein, partial [Phycisphaerales bacterium]|nr:DUF1559 domain-containing protein [Phycisphaerales bacterium]